MLIPEGGKKSRSHFPEHTIAHGHTDTHQEGVPMDTDMNADTAQLSVSVYILSFPSHILIGGVATAGTEYRKSRRRDFVNGYGHRSHK